MSNLIQTSAIESALVMGDLSKLTADQRLSYYKQVCDSVGLNALTKPFDYINLNGKLTLYAKRDATDQLRKVNKVSITVSAREKIEDVYIVTAKAKDKDGREDESTGAVNVAGLKGEALANAFMKAETKAKRRVTLSICGLGMLDETEVETIKDATPMPQQQAQALESNSIFEDVSEEADPASFVIGFGKYKGQKLGSLDIFELDNYVSFIKKSVQEKGKDPAVSVTEFMTAAEALLTSKEFERT